MTPERHGEGWSLYCADWRTVSRVAEGDHVVTDPPYGSRTHKGQKYEGLATSKSHPLAASGDLGYDSLSPDDVAEFCAAFSPVAGWLLAMTSHDLIPSYEVALLESGRYVFAPVPIVTPGSGVRFAGDGPSSWTVYTIVSRQRSGRKCWGTKPGAYTGTRPTDQAVKGSKSVHLMEAIVRDYSDPGDTICDPYAGGGATGVAAIRLGRKFIGCECNRERFEFAARRLERARPQGDLFSGPGLIGESLALPGIE